MGETDNLGVMEEEWSWSGVGNCLDAGLLLRQHKREATGCVPAIVHIHHTHTRAYTHEDLCTQWISSLTECEAAFSEPFCTWYVHAHTETHLNEIGATSTVIRKREKKEKNKTKKIRDMPRTCSCTEQAAIHYSYVKARKQAETQQRLLLRRKQMLRSRP